MANRLRISSELIEQSLEKDLLDPLACPYRVKFAHVSWQTAEELSEPDRTGELNWAIRGGKAGPLIELAHTFTVKVGLQRTWVDRRTCTVERTHLTLNNVYTWNLSTSNRPHHWSSASINILANLKRRSYL
jgi:hypothetical protein